MVTAQQAAWSSLTDRLRRGMWESTSRPRAILGARSMPEYVIEREIPGAGQMTEDQVRDISIKSLEVLRGLGPQIQWLHSYVTDDRLYCVYLAPNEDLIREHAHKLGVPANRISAVRRMLDPKRYS
jgi:hypothetical protein